MPRVAFHPDALADIDGIKVNDPDSADHILAVLQQVRTDQDLLDRLTQHNFGADGTADFHVSRWKKQQNKHHRNLWRMKVWGFNTEAWRYRIVYAFAPTGGNVYVLGVVARKDFNYEDDEFTQRVINCYDKHFSDS